MKEHDIVYLICGTDEVPSGSKGTIIHSYPNLAVHDVEFVVKDKNLIIEVPEFFLEKSKTN